jgi:hypothetical protein
MLISFVSAPVASSAFDRRNWVLDFSFFGDPEIPMIRM